MEYFTNWNEIDPTINSEQTEIILFMSKFFEKGKLNEDIYYSHNFSKLGKLLVEYISKTLKPFYLIESILMSINNIPIRYYKFNKILNYEGLKSLHLYLYILSDYGDDVPEVFIDHYKNIEDPNYEFFRILFKKHFDYFHIYHQTYQFDIQEIIKKEISQYQISEKNTFEDLKNCLIINKGLGNKEDWKDATTNEVMEVVYREADICLAYHKTTYLFEHMTIAEQIHWVDKIKNEFPFEENYPYWIQSTSTLFFELFENEFVNMFERILDGFKYDFYHQPSKEFVEFLMRKFDNDLVIVYLFLEKSPVIHFYSEELSVEKLIQFRGKFENLFH